MARFFVRWTLCLCLCLRGCRSARVVLVSVCWRGHVVVVAIAVGPNVNVYMAIIGIESVSFMFWHCY